MEQLFNEPGCARGRLLFSVERNSFVFGQKKKKHAFYFRSKEKETRLLFSVKRKKHAQLD